MAMNMTGEVQLSASREAVWAMLNEPAVLKSCIPGCESLDKDSDNEFRAVATIKIGPVKARWKGKVRFSDLDPPNSYRISGEGEGGVAGFAKGGAKGLSRRQGWWYIVVLQRRSADRRQARPARAAPHQQRGEEDRRRFL
jgi:carbon monoxide dehydrogenase subunit G